MIKARADAARAMNDIEYAQKEFESKAADREMKERIQLVDVAQNLAVHPLSAPLIEPLVRPALEEVRQQNQVARRGLVPPQLKE